MTTTNRLTISSRDLKRTVTLKTRIERLEAELATVLGDRHCTDLHGSAQADDERRCARQDRSRRTRSVGAGALKPWAERILQSQPGTTLLMT